MRRVSSEKRIAANIRNAQLSTGPRTCAGKAKVSMNALRHGLTSHQVILPNENSDEFESFRSELLTSLAPDGALETFYAEKIVTDIWRVRRVPVLEAALYCRGLKESTVERERSTCSRYVKTDLQRLLELPETEKVAECDREAHAQAKERLNHALSGFYELPFELTRVLEKFARQFMNLLRHENALSHSITKNLHELQRLQAARRGQHVAAPSVVDVNINLADRLPVDEPEKRITSEGREG
jgi:hypothetical protein